LHRTNSPEGTSFHIAYSEKGNSNKRSLAYTSLVGSLLEYGAACWDPYREGQINALVQVLQKAAKFANHTNDSVWETLAQRKKKA
jgi:hypothetical protein